MLFLLTGGIIYSQELNNKFIGKIIIIDPGHGGVDSGTVSGNLLEKDLNLSISLKLRDELIKSGFNVIMTRDGDYDLSSPNIKRRKKSDFDNRIELINNSNADLYLSIHINYLDQAKYYGAQTFYTKGNKLLADVVQASFKTYLNSPLDSKEMSEDIYMYKKLNIPGILIECGFISNYKEKKLLVNADYQMKIVNSIIKGLNKYY